MMISPEMHKTQFHTLSHTYALTYKLTQNDFVYKRELQDGRVVNMPAFESEGSRFDPRQQPNCAAVIAVDHTITYKLTKFSSLFTIPSFG